MSEGEKWEKDFVVLLAELMQRYWGRAVDPVAVPLTPGSVAVLAEWEVHCEAERAKGLAGVGGAGVSEAMVEWWSRAAGLAVRLAGVSALVESASEGSERWVSREDAVAGKVEVDEAAMTAGVELARYFSAEQQRYVDEMVRPVRGDVQAKQRVLDWLIRDRGWLEGQRWTFSARDAFRAIGGTPRSKLSRMEHVTPVLEGLVVDGWLRPVGSGRSDARKYLVHPWIRAGRLDGGTV